jgi:hypothetical protein
MSRTRTCGGGRGWPWAGQNGSKRGEMANAMGKGASPLAVIRLDRTAIGTARPLHCKARMKTTSKRHRFLIAALVLAAGVTPAVAKADVVVRAEGLEPPRDYVSDYPVEIEPHFTFGPENVYGASGFGAGLRVGIPLMVGRLGSLSDNLAISFGGDVLHYDNCFFGNDCGANYLMLPVAAQVNLFVLRSVSLFAEGGAFLYKGWFDGCRIEDGPGCTAPSDLGVLPTLAIGGRIHLGQFTAVTLRLGYPTTTIGLSFL